MLVCATLIHLCSSCGCEVVLTMLKFISYISCILYASISTCRENSVKSFKYIYVYLVFMKIYMHISRVSDGPPLFFKLVPERVSVGVGFKVERRTVRPWGAHAPPPNLRFVPERMFLWFGLKS